jgi:signal recognition particle GTPase
MDKAEKEVRRKEGIICSMTQKERKNPAIIKATRKNALLPGPACRCTRSIACSRSLSKCSP